MGGGPHNSASTHLGSALLTFTLTPQSLFSMIEQVFAEIIGGSMRDSDKTKSQLVHGLRDLRRRVSEPQRLQAFRKDQPAASEEPGTEPETVSIMAHAALERKDRERFATPNKIDETLRPELAECTKPETPREESLLTLKDFVASLPQPVYEIDANGKILFVNRRAADLSGYSRHELEEDMTAFDLFIPEDRDRMRADIQRVLAGEDLGGDEYTALSRVD